jgi:response regulator RpfG family c-di-GMP phosphodiesterase
MRVLIVEHDESNVALIRRMISRIEECSVGVYPEPAAIVNELHDLDFDLALISYGPHGRGLALTVRIREIKKHAQVPVVIMTSRYERPEVRVDAFEVGATDVLMSPLEPAEFRVRIRNLLQIREAQLALANRTEWLKTEVTRATEKLKAREQELVLRLCRAVEYHDAETGDHIDRMARYCYLIAQELGFPEETCEFLQLAAHMHDIGKLGVSSAILRKPARLTAEERIEMEQHTLFGEKILEGSSSPLIQLAAIIAGSHHERWDGSGYPRQLKGADIPIAGRIAAVADVFDALTSARRYKQDWPIEDAFRYLIEHRGRHFDPACVDALLRRRKEIETICSAQGEAVKAA